MLQVNLDNTALRWGHISKILTILQKKKKNPLQEIFFIISVFKQTLSKS